MKTALIVGATGLTGTALTSLLIKENYYDKVIIVVRKPVALEHPRLEQIVCDFEHLPEGIMAADDYFCCLGTTMKKAGSKAAFEKVDYEYPLKFAQIAKQHGAAQFIIITAIASDSHSKIYYSRVKGRVEEALKDLNFSNLVILRPSFLFGDRKELRIGEKLGIWLARLLEPLIPRRYRGVEATTVAAAMSEIAKKGLRGVQIIESEEITPLSQSTR